MKYKSLINSSRNNTVENPKSNSYFKKTVSALIADGLSILFLHFNNLKTFKILSTSR